MDDLTISVEALVCQTFLHDVLAVQRLASGGLNDFGEPDRIAQLLSLSCHMTAESTLFLVSAGRHWDAEILLRSVLEGTYKYIYLTKGSAAERTERYDEFWNVLPQIYKLKTHHRIELLLSEFATAGVDPATESYRPFRDLLVPDSEVQELRQQYPKAERRKLEDKWSYFPLSEGLSKIFKANVETFPAMSHGYGVGCHQTHKDGEGVAMVWERAERDDERQESIDDVHGCRILTDLMTMAAFRLTVLMKSRLGDAEGAKPFWLRLHSFLERHEDLYERWHRIEYKTN